MVREPILFRATGARFVRCNVDVSYRVRREGFVRAGRGLLHHQHVADAIADDLVAKARLITSLVEGWSPERWDTWELLVRALYAAADVIRRPQTLPRALRERLDALDAGLLPAEVLHLPLRKLRARLRRVDRQRAAKATTSAVATAAAASLPSDPELDSGEPE